jgi:DnaJ-class molecular chaperone
VNIIKNYYAILGVSHISSDKEIKKSYYSLSKIHHPDKKGDELLFKEITEAYDTLLDKDLREEYDKRSRFGKNYNEVQELFNVDFNYNWDSHNTSYEDFKKNDVLDIIVLVQDDFDGNLEFGRWVICKECRGLGKDLKSKIQIKDENGNIIGLFDSEDGCDFCEGTGKDFTGNKCAFCNGGGKVGASNCKSCKGERRIFGSQKVSKVKLTGKTTKIKSMGHFSKTNEVGDLILILQTPES